MTHLLRYALRSLFRVVTLVNDVTDLLTVHDEVDAISGECQKGVMDVMQLTIQADLNQYNLNSNII